jgi:hypothetical protein
VNVSSQVADPVRFDRENSPVNIRVLLLIVEKIKNNAELEAKPPGMITLQGAEGKWKMESIASCIPQKPKQISFSDKQCTQCKKQDGSYKSHNTRDCRKLNPNGTP